MLELRKARSAPKLVLWKTGMLKYLSLCQKVNCYSLRITLIIYVTSLSISAAGLHTLNPWQTLPKQFLPKEEPASHE
jgi:hypothetical protein